MINEESLDSRGIFRYRNGRYKEDGTPKFSFGDPLLIEDRIREATKGIDYDATLKNIASEFNEVFLPAASELVPIICSGFNVSEIDQDTGDGLTRSELIGLLNDFYTFTYGVKKNTEDSPGASPVIPELGSSPSEMSPPGEHSAPTGA